MTKTITIPISMDYRMSANSGIIRVSRRGVLLLSRTSRKQVHTFSSMVKQPAHARRVSTTGSRVGRLLDFNPVEEDAMKKCSMCKETKPYDCFTHDYKRPDGYYIYCKDCRRSYERPRRESAAFKLAKKQYDQKYYRRNQKKRNQQCAAWYASNPEHHKELREAWKAAHPAQLREYDARRSAWRKGASTERVSYEAILERDGYHCHICGGDVLPDDVHFDHVIPLSKGGAHSEDNIRVSHSTCNLRKWTKILVR